MHRDIKPDNFVIGMGKNANTLFLIDFGLAKRYISPKTNEHLELTKMSCFSGNIQFCSANA